MASYKELYQKLHGIVKKQFRLSVQGQKNLMKEIDAVLTEAYHSHPGEIKSEDKVIAVAQQKDFSASAKPEVTDSKKKDQERGYRWVGGSPVKLKNDNTVIDTSEGEKGVDETVRNQVDQSFNS